MLGACVCVRVLGLCIRRGGGPPHRSSGSQMWYVELCFTGGTREELDPGSAGVRRCKAPDRPTYFIFLSFFYEMLSCFYHCDLFFLVFFKTESSNLLNYSSQECEACKRRQKRANFSRLPTVCLNCAWILTWMFLLVGRMPSVDCRSSGL